MHLSPLLLLAVGVAVVLLGIVWFRLSAFLSLIAAALCVSLLSPGRPVEAVEAVTRSFGEAVGKIGLVIAFAAVIGRALTDSGAAQRLVRSVRRVFGASRAPWALMVSGFVLSIPVFFDTVFYLLLPLARQSGREASGRLLYSLLAVVAGAAITHTLVPPTPGPLAMALALDVDVGLLMAVGAAVAVPASIAAMALARRLDRRIDVRDLLPVDGSKASIESQPLPGLLSSLLPVVLPVALIGWGTAHRLTGVDSSAVGGWNSARAVLSHPAVALGLAMLVALWGLRRHQPDSSLGPLIDDALKDAGTILLITAAGSAFGASLQGAGVGEAVASLFGATGSGAALLFVAFGLAAMLKAAQGSSTAAMVVGSSMVAALVVDVPLGFHPVYLCTALGGGALVGSWMNDSGFWLFSTMAGLGERRTLQTWTSVLACLGATTFLCTLALSWLLPLR